MNGLNSSLTCVGKLGPSSNVRRYIIEINTDKRKRQISVHHLLHHREQDRILEIEKQ